MRQLPDFADNSLFCKLVMKCSQILNTPVVEVYRHGIYLCMFFPGYAVFSHDRLQEMLEKYKIWRLAAAVPGTVYVVPFWGADYAATANLKGPLVNACAWLTCLALLGGGKAWWDSETAVRRREGMWDTEAAVRRREYCEWGECGEYSPGGDKPWYCEKGVSVRSVRDVDTDFCLVLMRTSGTDYCRTSDNTCTGRKNAKQTGI